MCALYLHVQCGKEGTGQPRSLFTYEEAVEPIEVSILMDSVELWRIYWVEEVSEFSHLSPYPSCSKVC